MTTLYFSGFQLLSSELEEGTLPGKPCGGGDVVRCKVDDHSDLRVETRSPLWHSATMQSSTTTPPPHHIIDYSVSGDVRSWTSARTFWTWKIGTRTLSQLQLYLTSISYLCCVGDERGPRCNCALKPSPLSLFQLHSDENFLSSRLFEYRWTLDETAHPWVLRKPDYISSFPHRSSP